MDLSNRDIAFLIWFGAAAIVLLAWRRGREAVLRTLRVLRGKLLVVAFLYAGYFALVVAGGQAIGIWNASLLKETLAWFVLAGIPLLAKFPETYKRPGFYRRAARRLLGIAVAIEFLVGLTALSLGAELLLLPAAVILVVFSAFAGTKPEYSQVKKLFDGALVVLGLMVIALTVVKLIEIAPNFGPAQLGLLVFLPVWATFFTLLFVFVLGLYANYEPKMGEINRTRPESRRARSRAKLALISAFGAGNLELGGFAPFEAGSSPRPRAGRRLAGTSITSAPRSATSWRPRSSRPAAWRGSLGSRARTGKVNRSTSASSSKRARPSIISTHSTWPSSGTAVTETTFGRWSTACSPRPFLRRRSR